MDNDQTNGNDKNYLKHNEKEIRQTIVSFSPLCPKDHILKMSISELITFYYNCSLNLTTKEILFLFRNMIFIGNFSSVRLQMLFPFTKKIKSINCHLYFFPPGRKYTTKAFQEGMYVCHLLFYTLEQISIVWIQVILWFHSICHHSFCH